jgi:hypothetical protein
MQVPEGFRTYPALIALQTDGETLRVCVSRETEVTRTKYPITHFDVPVDYFLSNIEYSEILGPLSREELISALRDHGHVEGRVKGLLRIECSSPTKYVFVTCQGEVFTP